MRKLGFFLIIVCFSLPIQSQITYSQMNNDYFNCTADTSNLVALVKTVNASIQKPNKELLDKVRKIETAFIRFAIFSAKKNPAQLSKYKKKLLDTLGRKSDETKKKMGEPDGLNKAFKKTFISVQRCTQKYLPVMKKQYKQIKEPGKK